ncbi:hypothetical protein YC2023_024441 [Brassica napus]
MKLVASHQSPFHGNNTAKLIILTKKIGHGYDPFATVEKQKVKVLVDYLKKTHKDYKLAFVKKRPPGSESLWYAILQTPTKWLVHSVSPVNTTLRKNAGRLPKDFGKTYIRLPMQSSRSLMEVFPISFEESV